MKKLRLSLLFLAATMAVGTGLKAQEVTRTLMPGWTWISCPTTDTINIATAMGSFVPMQNDVITTQGGTAIYMNGQWRGNLSKFYPGYGYHYKSNRTEPVTVTFQMQQPSQVVVTTLEPTDITLMSAVVGSDVAINAGNHIFLRGICWGTEEMPTVDGIHTNGEAVAGSQSITLDNLTSSTTYYVRAYVVTDLGLAYGSVMSFTTLSGIPEVSTAEVTDITTNSATCGGTVTDDGGLDITACGVCWGTEPNPTIVDSHTTDSIGLGSFVSTLTDLMLNTTYYVRAYASNSNVTVYGDEVSFTTLSGIPEVSTAEVTDITTNSATCGGTVTDDGGLDITACGVCWGTEPNPTIVDSHTTDSIGLGSFVSTLTDLMPNTTYYVRAYASNSNVTVYGNEVSFTTEIINNAPTGAINGKFTIDSDGNQIYFSQGNLQYIGSATTPYWKFADNQWDCLGTTTGQNSNSQNVDRDLFGWGTSGWNCGNTCYRPWDTYNSSGSSYGPAGANNLTGTYVNSDWGVYNPISNGGDQTEQWRTLTKDEWGYVFDTRTTVSGIRYAKANVNDVNGVILLPDDWSMSYYNLSDTNTNDVSYSSNIIPASEWITLEQHGAVFLPATGYRFGTSVYNVGNNGYYWSSSFVNGTYAYGVYLYDLNLNPQDCSNRTYGRGVRLVCVAE